MVEVKAFDTAGNSKIASVSFKVDTERSLPFIDEDLDRSMRTARRKRNELLEGGYIMKEHEFQEWHVHLTEKGRGSIDPESE